MAISTTESELGSANRHQSSVGKVSDLASCQLVGRVRLLWQIKQVPEEIQGGNTQYENSERKSLQGSENTIQQGSGCLLYSGDPIPWWQLQHKTAGVGVFVAEKWIEKVFELLSLQQNHLSEAYSQPVCS